MLLSHLLIDQMTSKCGKNEKVAHKVMVMDSDFFILMHYLQNL